MVKPVQPSSASYVDSLVISSTVGLSDPTMLNCDPEFSLARLAVRLFTTPVYSMLLLYFDTTDCGMGGDYFHIV